MRAASHRFVGMKKKEFKQELSENMGLTNHMFWLNLT